MRDRSRFPFPAAMTTAASVRGGFLANGQALVEGGTFVQAKGRTRKASTRHPNHGTGRCV
jgi:hypothetical protein